MPPAPDEQEFHQFFVFWEPQVRAYLCWREGDPSVIEDAAQETMLSAHRYWDQLSERHKLRGWLFKVAGQRLSDARAARLRLGILTDPGTFPDRPVQDADPQGRRVDQMALMEAVRKLPPQQGTATALQLQDLPIREIARIMGISASSVKTHLSHARATLKGLLDEAWEESDGS